MLFCVPDGFGRACLRIDARTKLPPQANNYGEIIIAIISRAIILEYGPLKPLPGKITCSIISPPGGSRPRTPES